MATKKKKATHKLDELPGQSDAKAALDGALLLRTAQPILKALAEDLLTRAKESAALTAALSERHAAEQAQGRSADPFEVWLRFFTKQVAAAWFLSCVFVRVLEDRGLVEQHRIAGPGALDSQQLFFELAPSLSERDYLLTVFRELSTLPGAADLFDAKHNPVWLLAPSAERASQLLQLFRTPNANEPALRFGQADTRFLGDLYQDLDEDVRERFALLQTPHFVESFILDRTLERAIERFGLDDTTLIDPTCGSGHFLLGAFDRLFEHRLRAEPGLDVRVTAHKALDAVYGSDINPYAIAIARFRLTLAFLEKGGYRRLEDAPKLPLHLAVADSLLHNVQRKLAYQRGTEDQRQVSFGERALEDRQVWERSSLYELEDPEAVRDVLHREHAAVVGNPPYITVKDKALREKYRGMYPLSAAGKYSLGAPFTERFFHLGRDRGYVGMITANSFMKREFGKPLIEKCLPAANLDVVVNTSGAYIPGHGTPTVLLFGSAEPAQDREVLTVLAKRGEPSTPEDPERGEVWSSIAEHWSQPGFENDYISVAKTSRSTLAKHPWSLGGGGAAELKELLEERAEKRLGEFTTSIGFMAITGEDEVFARPADAWVRCGCEPDWIKEFCIGEDIRDWAMSPSLSVAFPYKDCSLRSPAEYPRLARVLWPYRRILLNRPDFGGKKYVDVGRPWFSFHQVPLERLRVPLSITFAFVATHNHFVLDRGGKVFNRSAPIIKLPESATEDDHLALLAYLNSSTACFWMKQVFYPKASGVGDVSIEKGKLESNRFEFAGTGLEALPLPAMNSEQRAQLVRLARTCMEAAEAREAISPRSLVEAIAASGRDPEELIAEAEIQREKLHRASVIAQEDIDWAIYLLCSLAPSFAETPELASVARRPFEPSSSSIESELWASREALVGDSRELFLLEQPVFKRLWSGRRGVFGHSVDTFTGQCRDAAREYLQTRAEVEIQTSAHPEPESALARRLSASGTVSRVVNWLDGVATERIVSELLKRDAIPFLAAHRYTDAGLDKRAAWERTWELQRCEDAGEQVGTIPVPPKYDVKDFRDANFFRLRGKLDVPKERFISYPGCESDEDGEPVYGWAGWNHLQQAQALAALYQARKGEGWDAARLTPMLAGLLELLPWLKQWHNEPSEEFDGLRLGDYFEGYVDGECAALGLTRDGLRAWRPGGKVKKFAAGSRGRAKVAVTMRDGSGDE